MPVIKMQNINKKFYIGLPNELHILKDISFSVDEGEFVSIIGPSGSGKSTLMNLIGALDVPTTGSYVLDGVDVSTLSDNKLSDIRNQKIGFIFQTFNLIPRSTALRNVELPMLYGGLTAAERNKRAKELLQIVEMSDRGTHRPSELSGGQKQRVAIARAMANDPAILLADEPTGALDSTTGRLVMDIFHNLHKKHNKTIILITHNQNLAAETQRIITLHDGEIISNKRNQSKKRQKLVKGD
ncbi:MAG: ABC transporter ATP-binding protein [Defluviitaleaceae bacterium]|nr:ABC transporter ATP-binding protein [Defluviitaleaceae bacterium]